MPAVTSEIAPLDKREAQMIIHSLGTSGQPPKLGALHVNVGTEAILHRLREEYLDGICASYDGLDGQGVCKWVEGNFGNGKTQFLRCFQEIAWESNYVTAYVELSQDESPLDRPDRVYGAVARAIQAKPATAGDADRSKGFDVALAQLLDRIFPNVLTGLPDAGLTTDAINWVQNNLKNLAVESVGLRTAAVVHLLALLQDDDEKRQLSAMYLRGDAVPPAELRKLGIFEKIDKSNGFRVLRTMCQLLQRSGLAAGTVLLFDEARQTLSLMSAKGQKVACENLLSVVNRCNQGDLPGTIFLYGVMPEFFTSFAPLFPALMQRCGPATRIRLDTLEGIKESELLLKIGRRVAKIFEAAHDFTAGDEEALDRNLKLFGVAAIQQAYGTGARRLFVKSCVQMLREARESGFRELDAAAVERLMTGVREELRGIDAIATGAAGE